MRMAKPGAKRRRLAAKTKPDPSLLPSGWCTELGLAQALNEVATAGVTPLSPENIDVALRRVSGLLDALSVPVANDKHVIIIVDTRATAGLTLAGMAAMVFSEWWPKSLALDAGLVGTMLATGSSLHRICNGPYCIRNRRMRNPDHAATLQSIITVLHAHPILARLLMPTLEHINCLIYLVPDLSMCIIMHHASNPSILQSEIKI